MIRREKLMVAFLVVLGSPVCGQWRQRRWRHGKERGTKPIERRKIKTRRKVHFYPTLVSNFFMLNAQNPPLFIEGRKGTFHLYPGQILALDLTMKNPNNQLKGTIIYSENWLLKDGQVGHFRVAPTGSVGWQDLFQGVVQCQVIIMVYGLSGLVEIKSIKYS